MKIYYNTKVKIWKGILNVSEIDRKTYRNIEVFVMATMSSGKSTLINALLSKKLLPSSNEACTATITKVINTNQENYSAKAYSEKRELLYKEYNIYYEKMKEWNNNETQVGIIDDSNLLDKLIKNVGNDTKNIIFALNKLDCFNEDDDILETIIQVYEYLEKKGVKKPNIFPVAALPALAIRSEPQDELEKLHRNFYINIMNIDENLHLEKYIVMKSENYKLKNISNEEKALFHTGIHILENKIIESERKK